MMRGHLSCDEGTSVMRDICHVMRGHLSCDERTSVM